MKRKTAAACLSFLAGLFAASFLTAVGNLLLAALCALAGAGAAVLLRGKRFTAAVTILAGAFCGLTANAVYTVLVYDKILSYDGQTAEISGVVEEFSYTSSDKMVLTVRGKINGEITTTIRLFAPYAGYAYGERIVVTAELEKITDSLEFQSERYYKPKGIYLQGTVLQAQNDGVPVLLRPLGAIRTYADTVYGMITDRISGDAGAFLGAMLCGNTADLSDGAKLSLYRAGIGHIFSVSGAHLVICAGFVLFMLKALRAGKAAQMAVTEVFILAFCVFAGMKIPVLRAAFMATVLNLAPLVRRKTDTPTLLAICGAVLTVFSPYTIRDVSFLLSMSGVFGLAVAASAVCRVMLSRKSVWGWLFQPLIAMVTVTVVNLPLCVLFFDEISLIAPIMNLVTMPLCSAGLILGVVAALTAPVAFLTEPLLLVGGVLSRAVLGLSALAEKIPYSFVPAGSTAVGVAAVLAALGAGICMVIFRKARAVVWYSVFALVLVGATGVVTSLIGARNTYTLVLGGGNSTALLIYRGDTAVIVDVEGDGDMAAVCRRVVSAKGIKTVRAVISLNRTENKAAVYSALAGVKTETIQPDLPYENALAYVEETETGLLVRTAGVDFAVLREAGLEPDAADIGIDLSEKETQLIFSGNRIQLEEEDGGGAYLFVTDASRGTTARRLEDALDY